MAIFGPGGRDLTGWETLRRLHESVYAKEELAELEGRILFETQMPYSSPDMGSPIDLRAGTTIQWNLHEDMLDHHWEMRRMDRISPAWRALLPSEIDSTGYADADCWIEMDRAGLVGVIHKDEAEETESTLRIIHESDGAGGWEVRVEVAFIHDGPSSDALALFADPDALADVIEVLKWHVGDHRPFAPRMVEDEMRVVIPTAALQSIDASERKSLE